MDYKVRPWNLGPCLNIKGMKIGSSWCKNECKYCKNYSTYDDFHGRTESIEFTCTYLEVKNKIIYYFICLGAKTSEESRFNLLVIAAFINLSYPKLQIEDLSYIEPDDNIVREYRVRENKFKGDNALFEAIEYIYSILTTKNI